MTTGPMLTRGRAQKAQIGLIGAFFTQGFVAITYIPRIPELIDQINVSFVQWGLIMGFTGIGSLIPLLVSGRLVAKYGTRPIIFTAAIVMSVILATFGLAHNGITFFILATLFAFAMGFYNLSLNAQSVMFQNRLGRVVIGKFHAAWSIGAASSSLVSGFITFIPLWLHLVSVSVLAIGAFIFTIRMMLSPAEDGHKEEKARAQKVSFFKSPPMVWLLAAGLFSSVFPELMMMDWSAVFAKRELGLNAAQATIPYSVFILMMIVGRLQITRLTKKYHFSHLAMFGGLLAAVSVAIGANLGPVFTAQDKYLGLAVSCVFWALAGIGMSSMVPSFFSASGNVPGLSTAQVMARTNLVNMFGVLLAKIAMGALAQGTTVALAYLFPASFLVVAAIVARSVAKRVPRPETAADAFPPTGAIQTVAE